MVWRCRSVGNEINTGMGMERSFASEYDDDGGAMASTQTVRGHSRTLVSLVNSKMQHAAHVLRNSVLLCNH